MSGTISWSASAWRTSRPEERDAMLAKGCSEEAITNGTCGVEDLTFFVDGEWLSQVGGSDATYQLDTTKLPNGTHELTVRAQSWPDRSVWIGVDQRFVTVDNGRIELELRSGWNEIILAPGQTEQMNTGFYINPVWTQAPDLETQVEGWEDQYWDRIEAVLSAYDFSFLFTGDDVTRTTFELDNTLTNPWSKDFLQLALSRARDTRRVIGIEMVDEISFVWGDTPTPSDGRWLAGNPSIPDDAFIRLMMQSTGQALSNA